MWDEAPSTREVAELVPRPAVLLSSSSSTDCSGISGGSGGGNGGGGSSGAAGMQIDPNGQYESLSDGEEATETFVYTMSDGNGGTDSATVTIVISGKNDPPVAEDDNLGDSPAADPMSASLMLIRPCLETGVGRPHSPSCRACVMRRNITNYIDINIRRKQGVAKSKGISDVLGLGRHSQKIWMTDGRMAATSS